MPVRLFYGDADGDGVTELAEAFADAKTKQWKPIRTLEVFIKTFPHIRGTITRNKTFAAAALPQIIGPAFRNMKSLEIRTLSSDVFLNKTGRFEMRTLPDAAQLATAFGLCAADLDGDGLADLYLAQNDFGVPGHHSRYDSSQGLLLRGDGTGNFTAVPASESGIVLHGEQLGWWPPTSTMTGSPTSPWASAVRRPGFFSAAKRIELSETVPRRRDTACSTSGG